MSICLICRKEHGRVCSAKWRWPFCSVCYCLLCSFTILKFSNRNNPILQAPLKQTSAIISIWYIVTVSLVVGVLAMLVLPIFPLPSQQGTPNRFRTEKEVFESKKSAWNPLIWLRKANYQMDIHISNNFV